MVHRNISFEDMPGWCAGTKVNGINSITIKGLTNKELIDAAFDTCGASACLCITVNENEVEAIKWLVSKKWTQGPAIKNWNHNGRLTYMYFKQVTEARYNRG